MGPGRRAPALAEGTGVPFAFPFPPAFPAGGEHAAARRKRRAQEAPNEQLPIRPLIIGRRV